MYIAEYEYVEIQMNIPIPEQGLKALTNSEKKTLGWFENWEDAHAYLRKFYEEEGAPFKIKYSSESISITEYKEKPCEGKVVLRYEDERMEEKKFMVTERLTVKDITEIGGNNPFDDIMEAEQ